MTATVEERKEAGPAATGLLAWGVAIVPAMFILPMYVFPIPQPFGVGTYAGRRLLEILWLSGVVLFLLRPAIRSAAAATWAGLPSVSRWAAVTFLGGSLLSAVMSSAPAYALREWALYALLLVAVLPLSAVLRPTSKLLEAIALTLVLYAILIATNPLEHGFSHPRFQGQALAVIAPPVLFSGNLMLALMSAPALASGILNGSRALVFAIAMVVLAVLVLWRRRRRVIVPSLGGLALTAFLVAVYVAIGTDSSLAAAVDRGTSSTGRIEVWIVALERLAEAPLLGIGPGVLAREPGMVGWASHPHNSVLLVAAETGLVGLASITVLVMQGLIRLPRLTLRRRPWALALIGGGAHSLLSGTTVMPTSQAMLVLALALVLPGERAIPRDQQKSGATGWVVVAVGAVAIVVLMVTLIMLGLDGVRGQGPRFFFGGIP